MWQNHPFLKLLTTVILLALVLGGLLNTYSPAQAATTLTITPITWNIIGLDSNNPATGPRFFPVAARVCSIGGPSDGPVTVNFVWGDANTTYINLRTPITSINVGTLATGGCADAYFEVAVNPVMAAFDQSRPYTITATDADETVPTPQPRELYVEHLISQNRNATTNIRYGTTLANLTSVAAGGAMNLVVGGNYYIELTGGTATQGYEQFEEFITLTNTIFRINSVVTDYAADSSPYVTDPSDLLYADACLWENDVNSPNYRACLSAGKAGGAPVTVTYNVTIISGGGTQQTLNSLLYDFSGSSYHYNSDFSAGTRFANIIDPSTATIEKDFVPASISNGGVATLVFTLRNPNAGALSDYNFTDTLPTGMTIVNPPAPITNSCGSTATVNAPNGGNTISFSGGTLAANGTCTISVTVTAPVVTSPSTTYNNTSNNLFIGTVNTGDNAADSLTVTDAPLPPTCTTIPMATWTFASAGSATAPAPATANVTATAAAGPGLSLPAPAAPVIGADRLGTAGSGSWQSDNITDDTPPGLVLANDEYFEFVLNTTGFSSVTLQFYADRSAQGAANAQLYYGPVTGTETASTVYTVPNAWTLFGPTILNTGLNASGSTRFRLYVYNSGNNNNGHYIHLDDVTFTGCGVPRGPTVTKNFAPDPIAAGATSTLTFTLTNPNALSVLNNVSFTDNLPAGMAVATTPAASTTCGGTWNPLANALTLSFTGGVIPTNGTCTLQVNVTTSVLGPSTNISGFISSNESGVNNSPTGSATDTLTVIAPPQIDKVFSPNPIVAGGTSRLTFVITNPNQSNGISGVAFTDTLPAGVPGPGSMTVAAVPSPTNTCGGTWTTNPGAGSVSLAGVNIGAGVTCTVSVLVTVPSAGSYANTSGNVSHIVNGVPINGNITSDTLIATAPNPGIRILKQIGLGGLITDPWSSYLAVAPATPVYYLVTIENIGDVPLNITSVTDPNLAALIAACTWTNPLPVADALDDDHIDYCILGPVPAATGVHTNTATVNAQYGVNPLPPQSDSATYATTGLTIDKVANPTTYTAAGNVINYTITVTNTGSAILNGPVTVTDSLIPTLTCPALNTIGNNNNFFDPITSVPTEILVCTGTHTITAAEVTAGSVPNTATADTSQTAPVTDNVTVSLQNPALTLAKTGAFVDGNGDTLPQAGETINYTFLVTNTGNVALTTVAVTDPLIATITCPSGNPIPNLAVGGSQTCTGTYTLVAADITAGQVLNTATADSDQTSPVTDNETVILAAPALTLAKTGAFVDSNGDNAAQVGETINYTFLVTNTGNVALTNVAVTDPLIATITCPSGNPIPNLAVGGSQTCTGSYTLVAADITAGQVLNTATADSDQTPPVTDNETVNLAVPGLTLAKTGAFVDGNGDNAAQVGETINYTFLVTNTGNVALTTVAVTDPLITTITCPSGNPIPNLAVGGSQTCTGTYTLVAADITAGQVLNTATVDSDQTPPVTDNETVNLAVPALALVKTGTFVDGNGDNAAQVGETINYTFVVTNTGNVALTTVAVTDPLIATITCPSGNPIPNLAVGGSQTCTGTYTLVAADITAGQVLNTATADSDQTSPVTDNETVILAAPALTLAKTGAFVDGNGDNAAQAGETINYTFLITNTGNGALTNVAVTDPLIATITCPSGNPIPNLAVGGSQTCTGTYTLVAADITAGQVLNTATADSDQTPPVTDNETVNLAVPGLTLAKTGAFVDGNGDNVAQTGETINYTFLVTNTGNVALTTVAVTDPLIAAITCPSGNPIPNLAVGGSQTCTGSYTLVAADITAGQVLNTATADSDQTPPVTDNETVNLAVPALTLVKTGAFVDGNGDNAAQVGETINYTFLVTNTGNGALTNVAVTDPLITTITCPSGNPIPNLAIGGSQTCTGTYTLVAADITAGQVLNTATVDSDQTPPVTDNETVNLAVPALTLTKTGAFVDGNGDNVAQTGETINYTFLVTNTGNVALTTVAVTDPLIAAITCPSGNPIPNLAVGGSQTCTGSYTLVATDITAGQVLNTATVDSDQTPPVTDNETVNLAVPGLTLAKTGAFGDGNGDNAAQAGETINYTFLVTNTGNVALTTVAVTDPLVPIITCPSGNPIPNLAIGSSQTCTGSYILVAADITAGQVLNTATADSDQTPPVTDNETVNLAVPALTLVKTGAFVDGNGDNAAQVGEAINYTFVVTNTGNGALTNVAVTDPLITTITCPSGNPIPTLALGVSQTCTGSYTLVAADITAGQVLNTATADSDQTSPVTDNETVILAAPALTLAKTGVFVDGNGDNAAQVGETINYTFLVTNTGNMALTNVAVTDPLIATITCPSGNPIPNLAIGGSQTCTGSYTLVAADITAGQVLNTATVDSDQTPPVTDNETVNLAVPALTLTKTGAFVDGNGDNAAQVGETINYTFLVTNTGNGALTNVAVTDPLIATITCPSGNPIPNLAVGGSQTCTGTYTLVAADITAGQVLNTATADSDQTPPVTDNETVNLAVPALTLVKTGTFVDGNGDNAAQAGETINYTFLVTNTGNMALTTVAVTDPLIATITCPSGNPIPNLAIGGSQTCTGTYTLVAADITAGQVLNTATADSDQTPPVTDNETVNLAVPGLTLAKTGAFVDGNGDNAAQVGETINYTFLVTNTGNGALTNVAVTDPLIATITCPSGNPIPNLAIGGSQTCTGTYTLVAADITAGQVLNTATVDSDQMPPVTDNETVNLAVPALTLVKTGTFVDGNGDNAAQVGETINYTFVVTNTGNVALTNVAVTDPLIATITCPSGNPIPNLAVGGSQTCTGSYTLVVADITAGQVPNTATVDSDQTPPVTDNETVNLAVPALTLAKTGTFVDGNGDNAAQVGETINYTFLVTNTGNGALTNVAVTDPLIAAITCPSGNPIPNLAVGGSQTCTGTYTLVAADITAGQVLNTAMVDSDQTPPVTDNETVSLVASGLALIKTGAFVDSNGDNRAQVGETIAYTFMVTNTGNVALTNISVTDPLISVINCSTGNPIPTLAVGASQFCTGSHTLGLADIDAGQIVNTATADSDQTPPVSDTVTVVIPIGQPPNILYFDPSISKIGRLGPGQLGLVGEDLTWVVTITNIGNAPGTNVVICDVLVSELQVNSATIDIGTVTVQGQEVCFFVDTLAPGQVINGQINSTVLDTPASGVIQNTVTLTGTGTDGVVQVESATAAVPVPTGLPATGYPPIPNKSTTKTPFIWVVIGGILMTLLAGGWYLRKQKVF